MESKDYLGFIAYFIQKVTPLVSKTDMMAFLSKNLGENMFNAPLAKIRETSRYMYKGYVAQQYTRYGAFHIISKIESAKIEKYLEETIALNKKYKVYYDTVENDLKNPAIDSAIKKMAMADYKAVFAAFLEEDLPKKTKAKKAKVTKTKKPSAKVTKTKRNAASPKIKAKVGSPKKGKGKKKSIPVKDCSDYLVSELKVMASTLKIAGASKMKKGELCAALGM